MKNLIKAIICLLIITACSDDDDNQPKIIAGGPTGLDNGDTDVIIEDPFIYSPTQYLKEAVNFPMGNIVSAQRVTNTQPVNETRRAFIGDEYNSLTAENDMKMANMYSGPGEYEWSDGDAIVEYAKANGLRVHGHALVWHSSIPGWLLNFSGTDAEFETLVKDYVQAAVTHFAEEKDVDGNSVVASWDVVNEGFETTANNANFFRTRLGSDYIAKCFTWAREADADVKLFYNDFNVTGQPSKRQTILNMVSNFQSNNTPIDGIGMQMHLNYNFPTDDLPLAIEQIAATGLLVHISELDVKANPQDDLTEFTEERAIAQEEQYQRAGYYYTDLVPEAQQWGITIWGFTDDESWLYEGGSDWPLLYDNDFNFKIAHRGLIAGLNGESPD